METARQITGGMAGGGLVGAGSSFFTGEAAGGLIAAATIVCGAIRLSSPPAIWFRTYDSCVARATKPFSCNQTMRARLAAMELRLRFKQV